MEPRDGATSDLGGGASRSPDTVPSGNPQQQHRPPATGGGSADEAVSAAVPMDRVADGLARSYNSGDPGRNEHLTSEDGGPGDPDPECEGAGWLGRRASSAAAGDRASSPLAVPPRIQTYDSPIGSPRRSTSLREANLRHHDRAADGGSARNASVYLTNASDVNHNNQNNQLASGSPNTFSGVPAVAAVSPVRAHPAAASGGESLPLPRRRPSGFTSPSGQVALGVSRRFSAPLSPSSAHAGEGEQQDGADGPPLWPPEPAYDTTHLQPSGSSGAFPSTPAGLRRESNGGSGLRAGAGGGVLAASNAHSPRRSVSFRDDAFSEATQDLGGSTANLDDLDDDRDSDLAGGLAGSPYRDHDRRHSRGSAGSRPHGGDTLQRTSSVRSADSDAADSDASGDSEAFERRRLTLERRAAAQHRALLEARLHAPSGRGAAAAPSAVDGAFYMMCAVRENRERWQRQHHHEQQPDRPAAAAGQGGGRPSASTWSHIAPPPRPMLQVTPATPQTASAHNPDTPESLLVMDGENPDGTARSGGSSSSSPSVPGGGAQRRATFASGSASNSAVELLLSASPESPLPVPPASGADTRGPPTATAKSQRRVVRAAQVEAMLRAASNGGGAAASGLPYGADYVVSDDEEEGGGGEEAGAPVSDATSSAAGSSRRLQQGLISSPRLATDTAAAGRREEEAAEELLPVARRRSCLSDVPTEVLRHAMDHFLSIALHFALRLVCQRWNAMVVSNCVLWMRRVPNYLSHGYTSTVDCNVFLYAAPSASAFNRAASRQSFGNLTVATSTMSEDTALLSREQSWTTASDSVAQHQHATRYARPASIRYCFKGCAYRTWRSLRLQKALSAIRRFHRQKVKYYGGAAAVTFLFPPNASLGTAVCLVLACAVTALWVGMWSPLWEARQHPTAVAATFAPLWAAMLCWSVVGYMFLNPSDFASRVVRFLFVLGACLTAGVEFAFRVLPTRTDQTIEYRIAPYDALPTTLNGTQIDSLSRAPHELAAAARDRILSGATVGIDTGPIASLTGFHLLAFLPLVVGGLAMVAVSIRNANYDTAIAEQALRLFAILDEYCGLVAPVKRLPRRQRPAPVAAPGAATSRRLVEQYMPRVDPVGGFLGARANTATGSPSGGLQPVPAPNAASEDDDEDNDEDRRSQDGTSTDGSPVVAGRQYVVTSPDLGGRADASPNPAAPTTAADDEANDNRQSVGNRDDSTHADEKAGAGNGGSEGSGPSYSVRSFAIFNYAHSLTGGLLVLAAFLAALELHGWSGYTRGRRYDFMNVANASVTARLRTSGAPAAYFVLPDSPVAEAAGSPGRAMVWAAESSPEDPILYPNRLSCEYYYGPRLSFLCLAAACALLIVRAVVGMRSSWRKVGRRLLPFTASMCLAMVFLAVAGTTCLAFAFGRVADEIADDDASAGPAERLLIATVGVERVAVEASITDVRATTAAPPPTPSTAPATTAFTGLSPAPLAVADADAERGVVRVSCRPPTTFSLAEAIAVLITLGVCLLAGGVGLAHDKSRYYDAKMMKYLTYFDRLCAGEDLTTLGIDRLLRAVRRIAAEREAAEAGEEPPPPRLGDELSSNASGSPPSHNSASPPSSAANSVARGDSFARAGWRARTTGRSRGLAHPNNTTNSNSNTNM